MVSGTNICLYLSIILMFLAQSHVRSICMTHQFNFFQNILLFIFGCAGSSLLRGFFSSCSEQFLAALGLRCCMGFSLAAVSGDCFLVAACGLLIAVCGLLIAAASLDAEHRL